jgi:hypothetical protein
MNNCGPPIQLALGFESWSAQGVAQKPLRVAGPKLLDCLKYPLRLYRPVELFGDPERLFFYSFFRRDPIRRCLRFWSRKQAIHYCDYGCSRRSPPNNNTNNIRLHPGISRTAYSL